MPKFDTARVIAQIALRNLLANRWKTLIVGSIISVGAFLGVLGSSLVDGVDRSIARSVVGSVAGHIQVYSSESPDELDVMGGFGSESADITPMADYEAVSKLLHGVPNVAATVPMGISRAVITSGNSVDQALDRLRTSTRVLAPDPTPAQRTRYEAEKDHVRQIVSVLQRDLGKVREIDDDQAFDAEDLAAVERAASPDFWAGFDAAPLAALELLENRIAPLAADADALFLRYVGTDPQSFARHFDRFRVVEGSALPPGERGFLFSKYVYEDQVKLKAARGLDKIADARKLRHARIADDPDLQRIVRENGGGVMEILLQLDSIKAARMSARLRTFLHRAEGDLSSLLSEFFATDDLNFEARYVYFYAQLAPELELYRVRVGDTLTIKAFTRNGYVRSAKLKVYGTFTFEGLESSPQAGALNMMDMVSFRELYGYMTSEHEQEIAAMRAASGSTEVDRASADAVLFGAHHDGPSAVAPTSAPALAPTIKAVPTSDRYDPAQLRRGVALNVAVIVADDREIAATATAIERAAKAAGMPLKAVSWQKASGMTGQFAILMRAVIAVAVLIIFLVGIVVINNALVMATLERVRELGTLRAIGAQRSLVLTMLLVESLLIGLLSGLVGVGLGALLLTVLGNTGIPAGNDVLTFFFSGPRLHPQVEPAQVLLALAAVIAVSLLSGIYPAWLAMRVSPREAMQAED